MNRIVYNAATQAIELSFDFALTPRSAHFPAMATFSFLLATFPKPAEPFRSGLQRYYNIHPQIYARENRIHDQGAWMPFISDLAAIPNVADFGIKFQEGGGNASESRWMNAHGVDILPYIEPGLMHWSLPKGMQPTFSNLNRTVHDCARTGTYGTGCDGGSCVVTCKQIVADAMVDETGRWIYRPENRAWNTGAVFYTNLEMDTVGSGGASRAADQLNAVQDAYREAIEGRYLINGCYIDSSTAGYTLFNYAPKALKITRHPPVFDAAGRAVVLGAQPLFSFLNAVSRLMHSRGMSLMGNGLWTQSPMQLPGVFDIAGTETNWQAPGTAAFQPPHPASLAFNRAMAGSGPYLYLMDTDFSTWTKERTAMYFQICLAYGFWPSFFSANAATAVYFKNASLYERDRPIFKQFVPVLKAINTAGWEPLRHAALVGSPQPEADVVFVERFGPELGRSVGSGTLLFWTVRNSGTAPCDGLSLHVDAGGLGLAAGPYQVDELTHSVSWPTKSATLTVASGAQQAKLDMPSLPAGTTLVLRVRAQAVG